MTNKLFRLITFLLCCSLLAGCLGKMEINDMAMVMAVGLDKGEKPGMFKITAEIARPGDARGSTGAPTGQTGEPIYSVVAEGKSIFEAIRNLARFTSRRIFWAHNFIIVINEDLARQGIHEIIDFFSRNHELRMRTWVVVTPEKAGEVVSTITGMDVIPGQSMDKLFRYSEIVAEAPKTDLMTLQAAYLSHTTHPILARVVLKERGISNKKPEEFGSIKQVELSGTGVFHDDKLIGVLNPNQTRGLLWFVENVKSSIVTLPCPEDPKSSITFELKDQSFDLTPHFEEGNVSFTANLTTYGDMVEVGCTVTEDQQKLMKEMERELETVLKKEIEEVVRLAQKKYKSDFMELGKVFQNRYPQEWKVLKDSWDEELVQAKFDIVVKAEINSPVLLEQQLRSGK
ncbi:Ger(x)C family spore germination protein [Brevibacillus sp. SYSU BS000544]|uniref:Ger(x)C family spore germination protein n=1 Tax=Brevibacillus sp. SYSU BS000544 TaxID=3416443 RepID=UPI003CE44D46